MHDAQTEYISLNTRLRDFGVESIKAGKENELLCSGSQTKSRDWMIVLQSIAQFYSLARAQSFVRRVFQQSGSILSSWDEIHEF